MNRVSQADKMISRAAERILKYDTLSTTKNDLQLWLDAKLMLNEIGLLYKQLQHLNDVISKLASKEEAHVRF